MENYSSLVKKCFGKRFLIACNVGRLLFLRDFRYRYRQTLLGYVWAVLKPLLMGVPIIIVGRQFKLGGETTNVPYEAFTFVGLILFTIFWDMVVAPQWFMRRTRKLLKNIAFPHEAVLAAGCCQVLFNVSIYILLIYVVLLLFHVPIIAFSTFFLLVFPLIMIAGLSIGIFIAPGVLVYLDIRYCLPFISQALIWSIPVVYKQPEEGLLYYVNIWNPLTYLITGARSLLFGEWSGQNLYFLISLSFFILLLLLGFRFFHKAMAVAVDQIL